MALSKPEKYHAFISYYHKQAAIAKKVEEYLVADGLNVYNFDSGIDVGKLIESNIIKAVDESHKVVLLVSEEFMKSGFFLMEYMAALRKQSRTKLVTLVPVLVDVSPGQLPSLVAQRKALIYKDEQQFYDLLIQTVRTDIPTDEVLPAGDVGTGLAWSFFYGYLKLKLPSFDNQLVDSYATAEYKAKSGLKRFEKLVILIPHSCCGAENLGQFSGIEKLSVVDFETSRGGIVNRNYKSILYTVTDGNETYSLAVEFATPILSLRDMNIPKRQVLSCEELGQQRLVFTIKLDEILMNDPECSNRVLVLSYEDSEDMRNPESSALANFICGKLREQIELDETTESLDRMQMNGASGAGDEKMEC